MHVSKDMLDEGLRKFYYPAKWIAFFLSKRWLVKLIHKMERGFVGKDIKGLQCEELLIPSHQSAHQVRVRLFRPKNITEDLPGFLYLHGGGYMIGTPESNRRPIQKFIETKPCVIIVPDYRKAFDAPYPAGFNDCYDTLLWMKHNASMLRIKPDQFIVGGHSAGGGLTAAIALKARDSGEVKIAFQMPIYPMIDDRMGTASAQDCDAPVWNSKTNQLGWAEYLKDLNKTTTKTPVYAAPARETDYRELPPTITFVGNLEPFRDETIQFVDRLKSAGIPVKFEVFQGCFHGFDMIVPNARISKTAWQFVLDAYSSFLETYFHQN